LKHITCDTATIAPEIERILVDLNSWWEPPHRRRPAPPPFRRRQIAALSNVLEAGRT
jgi:hypothetical protein